MNTAVTITAIVGAVALINSAITAARDVAKARYQTRLKADDEKGRPE